MYKRQAQGSTDINGPHQGAWVETNSGESWFVPVSYTHLDVYKRQIQNFQQLRNNDCVYVDKTELVYSCLLYTSETNWKYVELVNPFVDSHRSRLFFFSSACRPFGMVSLSPDTDTEHSWGCLLYTSHRKSGHCRICTISFHNTPFHFYL